MTTNTTLELPRDLFANDDDVKTTELVRRPDLEARLARIEARQRLALANDQLFAVALLCLALCALGIAGLGEERVLHRSRRRRARARTSCSHDHARLPPAHGGRSSLVR